MTGTALAMPITRIRLLRIFYSSVPWCCLRPLFIAVMGRLRGRYGMLLHVPAETPVNVLLGVPSMPGPPTPGFWAAS